MPAFPELVPTTRSYDFGAFPISEVPSVSAGVVRFRHGATPQNYSLTISYNALSDADATLIRNHFQSQGGGFRSFALPSAIWTNHSFSGNVAPYKMSWRYIEPVEEEHFSLGYVNLTVALRSDGLLTDDIQLLRVGATFAPGAPVSIGGGFTLTVVATLIDGPANAIPVDTLALSLQMQQVEFSPYLFDVSTLALSLQLQQIDFTYRELSLDTLALVMFRTPKAFVYYALDLDTRALALALEDIDFELL
jgi:hypothetical protein